MPRGREDTFALRRPETSDLFLRGMWAVVAVGAVLRLARYVYNRSLWLDESLLGLNLISKSTRDLLDSLDFVQSAPPGFLVLEKVSLALFGESERVLRLYPFLMSLVGLVLFAVVCRRLLGPAAALLAVALFALNEPLIYQSSEVKPYSSDVTMALVLAWLALRTIEATESRAVVRRVSVLLLAGTAAIFLSFPSVFVVASAAAAVLLAVVLRRDWRAGSVLAGAGGVWLVSFAIVFTTSAAEISAVRGAIFSGGGRPDASALMRSMWATLADPGGFVRVAHGLAALALVAGIAVLARRGRPARLVLLAGPPSLAVAAAVLDRYPLGGRFSLFLAPFILILVVLGVDAVVSTVARREWRLAAGLLAAAAVLALPLRDALVHLADPPRSEHVRPLLNRVTDNWRAGDGLYVFRNAQYALRFYGECDDCGVAPYPFALEVPTVPRVSDGTPVALESTPRLVVGEPADSLGDASNFELLDAYTRVWALFSHAGSGSSDAGEEQRILDELEKRGRRLGSWLEPGAALYLYSVDSR